MISNQMNAFTCSPNCTEEPSSLALHVRQPYLHEHKKIIQLNAQAYHPVCGTEAHFLISTSNPTGSLMARLTGKSELNFM